MFTVRIIAERCKECGLCIHVCPKNVLAKGENYNSRGFHYTVPLHPERCVGCRLCEYTCPDFAITIIESEEARGEVV